MCCRLAALCPIDTENAIIRACHVLDEDDDDEPIYVPAVTFRSVEAAEEFRRRLAAEGIDSVVWLRESTAKRPLHHRRT